MRSRAVKPHPDGENPPSSGFGYHYYIVLFYSQGVAVKTVICYCWVGGKRGIFLRTGGN